MRSGLKTALRDPALKAARFANYVVTFRHELLNLAAACGVDHPSRVTADHLEWLDTPVG